MPETTESVEENFAKEATPARQNMRPPLRPQAREEDPRARAARRAAEIRDNLGAQGDVTDKFYVDPNTIPDGWSYEWKRKSTLNQEDPSYQIQLAHKGWEPVPASRHPSYMPANTSYETIERDGMILMERPKELTDEARANDIRNARAQVQQKQEQLAQAPQGQFDRANKDRSLVKVARNYEAISIPNE